MTGAAQRSKPVHIAILVGEHSGDQLGFKLMRALRKATGECVEFSGLAGDAMEREGMHSLFPLEQIAVNGILPVVRRLPSIISRVYQTVDAIAASEPDVLVIIDSPDFTHAVARRVRRRLPLLPIIDYVSPSVWAWRPGRARRMRGYVDHVLALLPFEPAAHARLGGPPCTYVGHPLIERLAELRPDPAEAAVRDTGRATILVLPGSRRSETSRLMPIFGEALGSISSHVGPFDLVLPAVADLADEIRALSRDWPVQPAIVLGESAKFAAFRRARAALAASGTVTLELALARVPMVVAYQVSRLEEQLKYFIHVPSIVLPNLVLGENAVPELLQDACTPRRLSRALMPLLRDGPQRAAQCAAFARLDGLMVLDDGEDPSARAARVVLNAASRQTVVAAVQAG